MAQVYRDEKEATDAPDKFFGGRLPRPEDTANKVLLNSVPPEVRHHQNTFCPSTVSHGLEWNVSVSGTIASVTCPPATHGMAHWICDSKGKWMTLRPDMSQCQSIWLRKIREKLYDRERQPSIVHLSNDMAHYAGASELYGGDILILLDTIETMTNKLRQDLEKIPTLEQRNAVITQVVQSIVKTSSIMIERHNMDSWRELGSDKKKRKALSQFSNILENAGLLLPEGVAENQEVTVTSKNIREYHSFIQKIKPFTLYYVVLP